MKQQKQAIAFIVLVLVAAGIWAWQWYTPSNGAKDDSASLAQIYKPLNFPNPTIHWPKVEMRRKAEYKGSGVNPFSMVVPPTPDEIKVERDRAQQIIDAHKNDPPQAPPDPVLPPNLKFFGYGNVPNNSARRAFLEDGDEVYIVNEGDTLLGRFKILKINNASLEFEEIGSGRHGQKMLEDAGPSA